MLERSAPSGQVIGFNGMQEALARAQGRLVPYRDRLRIVHASYADLAGELEKLNVGPVDGLLVDLGLSSLQLDDRDRGFSFRADAPLDMRMDRRRPVTAAGLVARLSEEQLADLFYHYGEERQARRIARFLVEAREAGTGDDHRQVGGDRGRGSPRSSTRRVSMWPQRSSGPAHCGQHRVG